MGRLTERNPSWIDDEMWERACEPDCEEIDAVYRKLKAYEDAEEQGRYGNWIPVNERLPEDYVPVNITWVNHNPDPYYASIKDVPFTATGICYKGKWYWYSAVCEDYLKEYGYCEPDVVDDEIEITAWMPLPESYRESEPHKQTNADEICSMTDEELAEFIINFDNHFGDEYEGEQSCLSWLQKESEEQ